MAQGDDLYRDSDFGLKNGGRKLSGMDTEKIYTAMDHAAPLLIIPVVVPNAASTDTDVTLDSDQGKLRVVDVKAVKIGGNGGASNTITVKNGSDAITDALDMDVVDKTEVRSGTIDDANHEIAAVGTLRVTHVKSAGNSNAIVYVTCVRA